MPERTAARHESETAERFDAIVIGAGISGLYQLHRLREQQFSTVLLEAGSGVGGVWFWNRYPGARLDSECYTYSYFFSDELRNEWTWSEEFAGQPELERYFNYVADKFDLRRDIRFNTRVVSAVYDQDANLWQVETADGWTARATFLITAIGVLSAPQFPPMPGIESFRGEWHHTGLWPHEPVEVAGKRVAVLGTGSSGVQIIAAIADEVAEMTVFQRTPNWCKPINNRPISAERAEELRRTYRDLYRLCISTPAGFHYGPRDQSALEVSDEERRSFFEALWQEPGMAFWFKNFRDLATSQAANDTVTAFISEKIRERVHDPAVAEKLIPKDHAALMKRPPMETDYYEVFNRDNVTLIDLYEEPILRFVPAGIETGRRTCEVDVIVFATGFDAGTGAFARIDIRGVGGVSLRDHWAGGPRTYLGLQTAGFPNLLMIGGPQSITGNAPRCSEYQVDWVTACLVHMRERGFARVEASVAAEGDWLRHVTGAVEGTLLAKSTSWFFGSNVPGKARAFVGYVGGLADYRTRCIEVANDGYRGFLFDARKQAAGEGDHSP